MIVRSLSREYQERITECYLPLVRTVLEAPPTSPLCEMDLNNMTSFILNLSAPTKHDVSYTLHDSLITSVMSYMYETVNQLYSNRHQRTFDG